MSNFCTIVLGVDRKHLQQLSWVFPTWAKCKPGLLKMPLVIFYDTEEVDESEIRQVLNGHSATLVPWPYDPKVVFTGDTSTKFFHPQRYKMLSGFVHVPARTVQTPYWLKLDTDVVATGTSSWIDKRWFKGNPAIVAPAWGFTKPPNQMEVLDQWVEDHPSLTVLHRTEPVGLHPEPGSDKLRHSRIISWCSFFLTGVTKFASECAEHTCGPCQLPVPSQDGYVWYIAKRLGQSIKTVRMKDRGWEWWGTSYNVRKAVDRVMYGKD